MACLSGPELTFYLEPATRLYLWLKHEVHGDEQKEAKVIRVCL